MISIEAARSTMELVHQLSPGDYPNAIGPGVYDIHSPRVPEVGEFQNLIREALKAFRPDQLWINPDCGLKTRRWKEVEAALRNMVVAARQIRAELLPDHTGSFSAAAAAAAKNRPYYACTCT